MKLLIVGSTGLVGRHVLDLALADGRIDAVVAPVRHNVASHPKLFAPTVDFERLPNDVDWWRADAVICALGTTIASGWITGGISQGRPRLRSRGCPS